MSNQNGQLVPIMNGIEVACLTTKHPIRYYLESMRGETLDLKAPYQRDECWTGEMKAKLIQSVLRGLKIAPLHLVEKDDPEEYFVLDGKQRLSAFRDFFDNKVAVKLHDDVSTRPLTYQQMRGHSNVAVKRLAKRFLDMEIDVTKWESMNVLAQRDLFDQLNQSKAQNTNEMIYCHNFLTRLYMERVWEECFQPLIPHLDQCAVRENRRFAAVKWVHGILLLCGWSVIAPGIPEQDLRKSLFIASATKINAQLLVHASSTQGSSLSAGTSSVDFDGEVQKCLNTVELIGNVTVAVKCLKSILSYNTSITRRVDSVAAADLICWLYRNIVRQTVTHAFVKSNLAAFYEVVNTFTVKKQSEGLSMRTTNMSNVRRRLDIIDRAFNDSGLDAGVKNRQPLSGERQRATMLAGGKCPVCQGVLNDGNKVLDHVSPKSITSVTEYRYICAECNRQKSNLTKKVVDQLSRYQKEGLIFEEEEAESGVNEELVTASSIRD